MHSSEEYPSSAPDVPAAGRPLPVVRLSLTARLRHTIADWQARARSRRLLAELDEHMSRDIGVDPARVWQETGKKMVLAAMSVTPVAEYHRVLDTALTSDTAWTLAPARRMG